VQSVRGCVRMEMRLVLTDDVRLKSMLIAGLRCVAGSRNTCGLLLPSQPVVALLNLSLPPEESHCSEEGVLVRSSLEPPQACLNRNHAARRRWLAVT